MQIVLAIVVSAHVLAGVFWAGSTFTLMRTQGLGAEELFHPQMGGATVSLLTGLYLWAQLHGGGWSRPEQVLALGIVTALIAAGVQGMLVGTTIKARKRGQMDEQQAHARIVRGHFIANCLLAVTVVCMAASRFV